MNKFRYIIGIIGLYTIVSFGGCVEKFEANIANKATEGLVIEGDIISDSTVVFRLSKTLPLTETDENKGLFYDYYVSDADLSVKGNDGSSWQGQLLEKGEYQVQLGTLNPDVEYFLEIQYNGDTYLSEPQKPLACSEIEKLSFKQSDLSNSVTIHLDSKEVDLSETKYYLWYFEEDWEVRTPYATTGLYDPGLKNIVFYPTPPVAQGWCYSGLDKILLGTTESTRENRIVNQIIQTIGQSDYRLSVLYSIRVQQRNLTRKEYEYYQVRAKLNSEMGGLFTPQPSELPTNITCSNPDSKVIGYVGCNMGVAHSQLYISSRDVSYVRDNQCDEGKDPDGSFYEKYQAGYQVGSVEAVGAEMMVIWVKKHCADVRSMNADPLGRPEWWPNPYIYK
ncbi:MAG: DUF4249 domain-containing protein [Bacteroides sp]|nr:DUF4249 domain-containing protein [Bacteroides sp.]